MRCTGLSREGTMATKESVRYGGCTVLILSSLFRSYTSSNVHVWVWTCRQWKAGCIMWPAAAAFPEQTSITCRSEHPSIHHHTDSSIQINTALFTPNSNMNRHIIINISSQMHKYTQWNLVHISISIMFYSLMKENSVNEKYQILMPFCTSRLLLSENVKKNCV